jgi:hypothetical protein
MEKETILQEADRIVNGQRAQDYGSVSESFSAIAVGWSSIAKTTITADQVALMMIWLKVCRANNNTKHKDSWLDIAGYVACWEKMENER